MDSRSQKLLFEAYYGILLKIAFRYVGTYEQAVEMTYKGFLKIFREFVVFKTDEKVKIEDALSVWIKRTFIVTLVDHIKSEPQLHGPRPIPGELWKQKDNRLLSDGELLDIELIKILKELPVSYRLVFNLFIVDGFSHQEIAGMLGITVEDSKQSLVKARECCDRGLLISGSLIPFPKQ